MAMSDIALFSSESPGCAANGDNAGAASSGFTTAGNTDSFLVSGAGALGAGGAAFDNSAPNTEAGNNLLDSAIAEILF
jgi:hypothetical protein